MTLRHKSVSRSRSLLFLGLLMAIAVAAGSSMTHAKSAPQTGKPQGPKAGQEYRVLQERPDRLLVQLPNRMLVIAQEVRTSPVVSSQVWIQGGSIYEGKWSGSGISHYLEHLASGGSTSTRTEAESNAILSRIGAQTNAATSTDTVRYYINAMSEHVDTTIDLLSDWMQNVKVAEREYERERTVIRREFEMGRGEPDRIMWKLVQQARWQNHPARHPVIGYQPVFEKITRQDLIDFHKSVYVPNNMVFVVVGDIDKKKVVDKIAAKWAKVPAGELPEIKHPDESDIDRPRFVSHEADVSAPRIRLAWPGTRLGGDGDYALDLLGMILGNGESSRLVRSVRDQQRKVNSITAFNYSTNWGEGFFGVDCEVAVPQGVEREAMESAVDTARVAILAELTKVKNDGVTAEELARCKRQIIADVVLSAQTAQDTAERLARDVIGMKDPDYLQHWAKAIQKVTAEQVQAAAKRFLSDGRRITVNLMPLSEGAKLKNFEPPKQLMVPTGVATAEVDIDNGATARALLAKAGKAGDDVTPVVTEDTQRFTLPNGLQVLVQRSTQVPAVSMQFYHLGGLLADEPGKQGVAYATGIMRMKGTATRSAAEISSTIESLGAALSTGSADNSWFTTAACLADDWDTVLTLMSDVTLNPSYPEAEWKKMQPRLLAAIRRQQDDWYGELSNHFRKAYFGDHQWSTLTAGKEATVAALSASDLKAFHQNHLSGSEAVLAIFGDVDVAKVKARVAELFGKLPKTPGKPFKKPIPKAPESQLLQVETRKPLAAVQAAFGPTVSREHPDFVKLEVLRRVMSNFPSGWLDQELRGKGEGLVYAVWAGQKSGAIPGYMAAAFNCSPDKLPKALNATANVIAKLRAEPVTEDTLKRAKTSVLSRQFLFKQSISDRASDAALNTLYGLKPGADKAFAEAVRSLTAKELHDAARKYLKDPVVVVLTHKKAEREALMGAVERMKK